MNAASERTSRPLTSDTSNTGGVTYKKVQLDGGEASKYEACVKEFEKKYKAERGHKNGAWQNCTPDKDSYFYTETIYDSSLGNKKILYVGENIETNEQTSILLNLTQTTDEKRRKSFLSISQHVSPDLDKLRSQEKMTANCWTKDRKRIRDGECDDNDLVKDTKVFTEVLQIKNDHYTSFETLNNNQKENK